MVFEKLVETTTGVTKDAMSLPDYAGLPKLSNPELHEVRRAVSLRERIGHWEDEGVKAREAQPTWIAGFHAILPIARSVSTTRRGGVWRARAVDLD